jgi:hypothetical protein
MDTETQDVSVRLPKAFIEDDLMPMFPSATKVSDAIRMAVQNDLERRVDAKAGTLRVEVEEIETLDVQSVRNLNLGDGE